MGCGAIGGVIGAALLQKGYNLTLVTHNEAIHQAIIANGFQVVRPQGRATVNIPDCDVHLELETVSGPFDIVLLAMKATGVAKAARDMLPRLTPEGYAVTLQNGIVEDRVGEILGRGRMIGALVGWGATMHAPGVYEMTSRGETTIGELDGSDSARVRELKAILEAAAPTVATTNIYGALWSKLAINCVVTTLGAVTGQRLGEMLRRAKVRRLALAIISEVLDVARAQGVTPEPVGGTLDLERLYMPPKQRSGGFRPKLLPRHAIMLAVGIKFRRLRSSMLQSLERGRRPEIMYMNGHVVEKGQEAGVPTPVNAALVAMVNEIEAGKLSSHPGNLAPLMAAMKAYP
jgi:2-dehydropantoate 2-reductase